MILNYQGTSFVSRIIRWMNWRKESHTSWSFCTIENGYLVGDLSEFEAWIDSLWRRKGQVYHREKIGMVPIHTKGTRVNLYELKNPLTRDEKEKMTAFLSAQVGLPYDFRGLFGFVTRRLMGREGMWFCAELVFAALLEAGRRILNCILPEQVYPGLIPQSTDIEKQGYIIVGDPAGYRVYQDTVNPHGTNDVLKSA